MRLRLERQMFTDTSLSIPRYGEASLADLVPSLMNALGVPAFDNPLLIEPLTGVCLLVVDGLGWELLRDHAADAPFLAGLMAGASPITTGFPSTTATSLASIGTGLTPGQHGFVGYTMAMPGTDRVLNVLTWQLYGADPPVDLREELRPEALQPRQTAFARAAADGVAVMLVGPAALADSGLTRAVFRGGQYQPVVGLGDLAAEATAALAQPKRTFVYAYHGELDAVGHLRGVASDAWRLHLGHIDRLVMTMAERLPDGAALVVTGDHGMVDVATEGRIDADDVPGLMAGVRVLGGEARARHIYCLPGAEDDVCAAWQENLGDSMWVLRRDEAIASGLFGPTVSSEILPRIGDVVVLAREAVGVVQRSVDPKQAGMIGHHGSVTPAEQLVPLLVIRP